MVNQLIRAFVLYIFVAFGTSVGFVLVRLYVAYATKTTSRTHTMLRIGDLVTSAIGRPHVRVEMRKSNDRHS
jgi:hypothetical protein